MKRNAASQSSTKAIADVNVMTMYLKTALEAIMVDHEARLTELKEAINVAENVARPRLYVANRESGKVHTILTRVEDIGSEAMCYCSFRHAKAPVKISQHLP